MPGTARFQDSGEMPVPELYRPAAASVRQQRDSKRTLLDGQAPGKRDWHERLCRAPRRGP